MKDKSKIVLAGLVAVSFLVPMGAAPLEYSYRITSPQKVVEKCQGSLNDGDAKTIAYWKGPRARVVCELPSAAYVKEVAVTLKKSTKWYLMNEVEVAVDPDGSGEFMKPRSVPVPIEMCKGDSPTIDSSCTNMTFTIPVGEKAVKVKVVVKTRAWGAISEIVLDDGKMVPKPAGRVVPDAPKAAKSGSGHAAPPASKAVKSSTLAADMAALPGNLTTVESKYFKMLVTPLGGRALSLRSKFLDAELTNVKADAGTFTECDWSRSANRWF